MRFTATVNTEALAQEEAQKLHEMVNEAGFFDLPEKFPPPERGADYFQYRLTVEHEGRKHTVEVNEQAVPAKLRPLLDSLMKHAKK